MPNQVLVEVNVKKGQIEIVTLFSSQNVAEWSYC